MKTIVLLFCACAVSLILGGCASCPCQGNKPAAQAGASSAYAAVEPGWTLQWPADRP